MTVMGERLPEAWMVEWHRNRRVEFPLRRWSWIQPPFLLVPVLGLLSLRSVPGMLDDGGWWRLVGYLLVTGYAVLVVGVAWQIITQRPVLVIDRRGIHLGRRRFLPWDDVGSIGPVTGSKLARQLEIFQKNVWAKNLTLTQQHVNDLHAFCTWLDELLNEHRQPTRGS